MNNVLITGANGYVGSHLIEYLKKTNNITGLDLFPSTRDDISFIKCDITNLEDVQNKLDNKKFDYIIHCAAIAHNDDGLFSDEDIMNVNYSGTKNLIDFLKNHDLKSFIFFSTVAVYGEYGYNNFIDEDYIKNPNTIYGQSKHNAEEYIIKYSSTPYVIFRFPAIYSSSFLNDIRKRLLLKKIFNFNFIFKTGNGFQQYSFANIEVVLDAVKHAIHSDNFKKNEIYHVADKSPYSLNDLYFYFLENHFKRQKAIVIPLSVKILKLLIFILGFVFKSKKDFFKSVFWKLAMNNLYSIEKLSKTGFISQHTLN